MKSFEKTMMKHERLNNIIIRNRTIDSAEGALRNQLFRDYNDRWHPVKKLKKIAMTEFVQSVLAQGRFFYLPTKNNIMYFIEEHKRYMWDEDSVLNDDPKVVKEDDHTCDAMQYFVVDNRRDLGLKGRDNNWN